jgi:hypothetical protein
MAGNGRLTQGLLVIVGAEAPSFTEITALSRRGQSMGRLLVDVDEDPPVEQAAVRSKQCPSFSKGAIGQIDRKANMAPTVSSCRAYRVSN